jgi:hypothetical protein
MQKGTEKGVKREYTHSDTTKQINNMIEYVIHIIQK